MGSLALVSKNELIMTDANAGGDCGGMLARTQRS